jgi:hypothetical protein
LAAPSAMFVGMERAARRVWLIKPNDSFFGHCSVIR